MAGQPSAGSFSFNVVGRGLGISSLSCIAASPPPSAASIYSYETYDSSTEELDVSEEVVAPSTAGNPLDDLLTAVLVLLVLGVGGCGLYQFSPAVQQYFDRVLAVSSTGRQVRNWLSKLMPAGASEAEISVFDDATGSGDRDEGRGRRRTRRGQTGTRVQPVEDDYDYDEDDEGDEGDEGDDARATDGAQEPEAAPAPPQAREMPASMALVVRDFKELD